jgi:hypothetical protein
MDDASEFTESSQYVGIMDSELILASIYPEKPALFPAVAIANQQRSPNTGASRPDGEQGLSGSSRLYVVAVACAGSKSRRLDLYVD